MHPFVFLVDHQKLYECAWYVTYRYCLWCNDIVVSSTVQSLQTYVESFTASNRDLLPLLQCLEQEDSILEPSYHLPKYCRNRIRFSFFSLSPCSLRNEGSHELRKHEFHQQRASTSPPSSSHSRFLSQRLPQQTRCISSFPSRQSCFLQRGTTDNHISKCLFCILSELCAELYADNNDSFVQPVNAFHYLWKRYSKLRVESLNSSIIPFLILQNELSSLYESTYPAESSFFSSLFNSDSMPPIQKPDRDPFDVTSTLPKRVKSPLIIIRIIDSYMGTVVFPERNLLVPNESSSSCVSILE